MSRRTEICRDFQRGSCRYGARCKFLHNTPQQQQRQPSNPFGFGVKNQSQQRAASVNYYAPLSQLTSPQRQQQFQSPAKEHRCSDPIVCKQQIKEDLQNEHPMFWRLTSYGHWKNLPNDLVGDVSFEELRAYSYNAGKQGMSFENLVQNERAMFNKKNMEFENLLNSPYRGPASTNTGFQSSVPSGASPIAFGKAALNNFSSTSALSSHPASPSPESFHPSGNFGGGFGQEPRGFSFGVGLSSSPAISMSPFGTPVSAQFTSQAAPPTGFSFGTQSPGSALPSVGMQSLPTQCLSGSLPMAPPTLGQNTFQFSKDFGEPSGASSNLFGDFNSSHAVKEGTMLSASFALQNALLSHETMSIEHAANEASTRHAASQILQGQPGQAARADIWLKESWAPGEIPEDEPPVYAR